MKFNVQVEIDWIEEGGDIDEILKSEVVSQILTKVQSSAQEQVKTLVYNRAKNLVDGWILEKLHEFADRPLRITDKWGDTIEHHESLTDMFKQQFDKFFDAHVDKDGKTIDGCGYGNKKRRVDYLLDKLATTYLQSITDNMDRNIQNTLDKKMQDVIKEKIIKHTAEQVQKITKL